MRTLTIVIDTPARIREYRVRDEAHAAEIMRRVQEDEGWTILRHTIEPEEDR
jgi:hypothetical protein